MDDLRPPISHDQYSYLFHHAFADSIRNKGSPSAESRRHALDVRSTSARPLFRYQEAEIEIRIGK